MKGSQGDGAFKFSLSYDGWNHNSSYSLFYSLIREPMTMDSGNDVKMCSSSEVLKQALPLNMKHRCMVLVGEGRVLDGY